MPRQQIHMDLWVDDVELPRTESGKTDRVRLRRPVDEPATYWAEVLGMAAGRVGTPA